MKYIFEEEDIKCGMLLGYKYSEEVSVLSYNTETQGIYFLTQINTDGLTYRVGKTKKEVVNLLNKDSDFIPISNEELFKERKRVYLCSHGITERSHIL